MNRWLKTLLLWLLMAALPLQGFAAAIQFSCAFSHPAAAENAHRHDPHAEPHQAMQYEHGLQAEDGKALHDGHTGCGASAFCCMGAALVPDLSLTIPCAPPSEAVHVSSPQLLPGYIPPGLERPPRPVSV